MGLEKVIPLETKEGNQYLLEFDLYKSPRDYGVPIIDITLTLVSENKVLNHQSTFSFIINEIRDYLNCNNVVLHYYCDIKEIYRRDMSISPQEYRSKLFNLLFLKMADDSLLLKNIFIQDLEKGNHYISILAKKTNQNAIELIAKDLNELSKD